MTRHDPSPDGLRPREQTTERRQPIETAPRDGSHFLLADFSRDGFGYIKGKAQSWHGVVHYWDNPGEEGFYLSNGGSDAPVTWGTHWFPLEDRQCEKIAAT